MHHFFVSKEEIGEEEILLRGENFHHLHKVLRGQIGEKILISDGEGVDYQCEIQSFSEDEASLSICFREEPHELPAKLILLQALPKGDKMEWIIQKEVELGISALIPLESKNTVMKLKEKKEEKKISRWQSIMDDAVGICSSGVRPEGEEDEKYLFGQCSQYQGISGSGGFDDHYHAGRLRKPVSKAQDGRGSGSLLS